MRSVKLIVLTSHVLGILNHDDLPVDTPDNGYTSNREEEDEPNPLRHIHLHSAEYDYWDGQEREVENNMDDVKRKTIVGDGDTCHWVVRDAIALQIPAF